MSPSTTTQTLSRTGATMPGPKNGAANSGDPKTHPLPSAPAKLPTTAASSQSTAQDRASLAGAECWRFSS